MGPLPEVHHHRNTTKGTQKSFKSRHATKSSLKALAKGKIDASDRGIRRTPHQQVMSKLERKNQARQKLLHKHQEHNRIAGIFSGHNGAPRIVAVVPLCEDGNAPAAVRSLNASLDLDGDVPDLGLSRTNVDRFKQKIEYIIVTRELLQCLDACRLADFVLLLLSPEREVDTHGELILRSIESQGIGNVLTATSGLDGIEPPKRRTQVLSSLKSYITHFFPSQERVHSLDSRQECANVIRSICTTTPKGIAWREERSWLLAEEVQWPSLDLTSPDETTSEVIVTGVVRGKALKADRLVQVADWGEFQIEKITSAPYESRKRPRVNQTMPVDSEAHGQVLDQPTADQDDLARFAPEEVSMTFVNDDMISTATSQRRGVLLDDHHYFSEDETYERPPPKRLPKGTSRYQASWFVDDVSDSDSELEEIDDKDNIMMEEMPENDDGFDGIDRKTNYQPTEGGQSEAPPPSEMFLDPSPGEEEQQLLEFRSRENDARDDLHFPDELELYPGVLGRERLARYRGLKSLKTSHWETDEDRAHEPEEWTRLLRIADYKATKNKVLKEGLVGGVPAGTRVNIHLRHVPKSLRSSYSSEKPLALFSLFRHEQKATVVNVSITLDSEYPRPIKSKETLIMHCGPRRFTINPLFSQAGHTPNNVHKFDRYLHPGRTAIATFIAPLTWGAVPALFFQAAKQPLSDDAMNDGPAPAPALALIGKGTNLPPDHGRVIAKRIILTGHPYKIHKKLVTVRYMFFNSEDVNWFKALQLWTRRGRSGFIKESLGTHGYFKATFDGKINPQDAVAVSLYKRVFPRMAVAWGAGG